jgi:hypothetical protein
MESSKLSHVAGIEAKQLRRRKITEFQQELKSLTISLKEEYQAVAKISSRTLLLIRIPSITRSKVFTVKYKTQHTLQNQHRNTRNNGRRNESFC